MSEFNMILPAINSFDEYESLKQQKDIFENATREIISRHHLPDEPLSILEGTNIVFSYGKSHIIKIFPPLHSSHFTSELLVMKHLHNKLSITIPAIEAHGMLDGWPYIVMSKLDGTLLEGLWEKLDHNNKLIIIRELGALIREVHSLSTQGLEAIDCHWQQFIDSQIRQCFQQQQATKLPDSLLQQIPNYIESIRGILPKIIKPVILTGEYTPMNLLVTQELGIWHIHGLIDFGDSMLGLQQYDLLGPGAFLIQGNKDLLREFLHAYGYQSEEMTTILSRQLTALMLLHRYSNLNVQIRIDNWHGKVKTIQDLQNLVWGF